MIYSGDTAPDLGRITWYAPGQSIVKSHAIKQLFKPPSCPRFLRLMVRCLPYQVAVPIPLPKGFVVADNYKIQFTYDGAILLTKCLI